MSKKKKGDTIPPFPCSSKELTMKSTLLQIEKILIN